MSPRVAWVDALRTGDPRTWRSFRAATPGATADPAGGASAGQLELVRRLAVGDPGRPDAGLPDFGRLADLVLTTPAAGRGAVDLRVPSATAGTGWGSPAIEPDTLPASELLRVAVPVLAALLPPAPAPVAPSRPPWRGRRFVVHGAPGAAASVAAALTRAGWVHGPFRATHLVLGCPLDVAVEQAWAHRVADGSVRGWRRTWRVLRARENLPQGLDPTAVAARVAAELPARRRAARLHVVVGADTVSTVAGALAVLGVRTGSTATTVDPPAVELRRRLHALTSARTLDTSVLDRTAAQPAVPLGVPAAHRTWAEGRAAEQAAALAAAAQAGNYPVHGDPQLLGRLRGADLPTRVDPADTLARALAAIGAVWRAEHASTGTRTSERTHP